MIKSAFPRSKTITVSALRKIDYKILHASLPVFHMNNTDLKEVCANRPLIFFVDAKLLPKYAESIAEHALAYLGPTTVVGLSCDEAAKTWNTAEKILNAAIDADLPRHGIMVAVGGGCLLDTVGVAASLYRRGVAYLRIPTTLIGMVDVAVGIKHGVNYGGKKNLLGTFYPSLAAINDFRFLETLSPRDFACGFAEMFKIAAVCNAELFESLEHHADAFPTAYLSLSNETLESLIITAEQVMIDELNANLYEDDLRRLADFGHTFSPLFETESNATISHGEAVSLDMVCSAAIATELNMCDPNYLDRFIISCHAAGLPVTHELCSVDILERSINAQRAHRAGNLNLVLPTKPGQGCFLQEAPRSLISSSLALMNNRVRKLVAPL